MNLGGFVVSGTIVHWHWPQIAKVLSLLEACFDLILGSSLSMRIQITGWKITGNRGFWYLFWLIRNQIKHFENHFFINIWFVNQDAQKWLKTKICIFYGEFENGKKKRTIFFFDLLERRFEPQIFSNFPAHDLNFHVKWGARGQIKTSF